MKVISIKYIKMKKVKVIFIFKIAMRKVKVMCIYKPVGHAISANNQGLKVEGRRGRFSFYNPNPTQTHPNPRKSTGLYIENM